MTELMNERENEIAYLANDGITCLNPECGNDQLEGGAIEVNRGVATQTLFCPECNWEWEDVYKLTKVVVN